MGSRWSRPVACLSRGRSPAVRDRTGVRIEQPGMAAIHGADLAMGYFEPNL